MELARTLDKKSLWVRINAYKYIYLLLFPTILFYIIFCYVPIYGIVLVFKTFDFSKGIMGSPWNNFQNFRDVLKNPLFSRAFRNTCMISGLRLLIEFPIPIIMALALNEITKYKLKRVYQTIFTFPHFLSWVIMASITLNMLSNQGLVNQILKFFGAPNNTILSNSGQFIALLLGTNIWKEAGWSTILYLAAIAGINPELYEAATVDGANRWQQMWIITWPELKTTVTILLILGIGGIMNGSFDQIFNMYNALVMPWADTIDTYVYRAAFNDATGFGYSTTVGFMKNIVNFVLLYSANRVVKMMGSEGIV
ncbi:MAG: ABC transporter permease subunit [Treponema sp.]|nr:ABC transporter permease subunit [Treponema sp.]